MTRAVVVIDGEHYPPVVRDAIAGLSYEVIGAWLAGGTEKLRGDIEYGVPLLESLEDGFSDAEVVVDMSDERSRTTRATAAREPRPGGWAAPEGADFGSLRRRTRLPLPLAVIGTGKRVGKTAVTGHVARLLARDRDVIVVAMGRGDRRSLQIAAVQPTLASLLDLSRAGHHAASDYLETAALTGVVTIGCRRAGGGLAGAVTTSNVLQGAALAAEREPDVVVFDGSGAAIPPIDVDARILVSGRGHDPLAYLNAYRVLVSDLVVLVGGGDVGAIRALKKIPVVEAELRLRPISPLQGRRVAVFTTGAAPNLDAPESWRVRNLANRVSSAKISSGRRRRLPVEIKAAAIDRLAGSAGARRAGGFAGGEVASPGSTTILGLVSPEPEHDPSPPLGATPSRHARSPVLEGTDGTGAGRRRRPARAGVRAREADRPGSDRPR
jgi:cyclic 2,3-diphosphoglycerate synthetase